MGLTPLDRKTALRKVRLTQKMVGEACHTDVSLVSHVIAGRRWMGQDARRIMDYICDKTDIPIEKMFPWYERRKGYRKLTAA